jgi:hypothetical protein
MRHYSRWMVLTTLVLWPVASVRAQTAGDPAGHWDGAIHAPFGDVRVEVDLATNDRGTLAGTFSNPAERLHGLPLAKVAVDGRAVDLEIKLGSDGQRFRGALSADGRSMSGDFLMGVYAVPFSLMRTGDARIEPPPRSPAIDKALEGAWNGAFDIEGRSMAVVVTMTNQGDGTATGNWLNEGGVQIPLTIAHQGDRLTLGTKVTPASYSGTVNLDGTEIVGTYTEGRLELPLTLLRVSPEGKVTR